MSIDIIIVFTLVLTALVLFASEIISFDVVALMIVVLLMSTGILTTDEALSGFSSWMSMPGRSCWGSPLQPLSAS
jgi:di/tricarboxylate transporter